MMHDCFKKRFAIVNECDRPEPRLVTQCIAGEFYYMSRYTEPRMRMFDGMGSIKPTWLEDFGFECVPNADVPGAIDFARLHPSKARYHDFSIRPWQGDDYFTLMLVDLEKEGHIMSTELQSFQGQQTILSRNPNTGIIRIELGPMTFVELGSVQELEVVATDLVDAVAAFKGEKDGPSDAY